MVDRNRVGGEDDTEDPEVARVAELLDKPALSSAESEELALYAADDPSLRQRIEQAGRHRELGHGWLERVHKDEAIQRVESGSRARIERLAGLGLVGLGYALHFVVPLLAIATVAGGTALLLYSFIRVRLKTAKDDPYKDVQR